MIEVRNTAFGLEDLHRLVYVDWNSPDSPLWLHGALPLDALGGAWFFTNARILLNAIGDEDGVPLTQNGNLIRAFVLRMVDQMKWPLSHMETNRRYYTKALDEERAFPLHVLRVVCQNGRLLLKRGRKLRITSRARSLLADDQAGALFRHLFVAFFQDFNLAYLDRCHEFPGIQQTAAVILWRLQQVVQEWIEVKKLPDQVLLPPVRQEIEALRNPHLQFDEAPLLLGLRILAPLTWFGLIEVTEPAEEFMFWESRRVRKTPLFDRFLQFEF